MQNSQDKFRLHIGMRNVKTAISATLCALIYFLIDRNPTFACIGAIFGMGSDVNNSKLHGGNRLFGTIFGGVIGMLLFRIYIIFYPDGGTHYAMLIFLFIGTLLLVLMSLFFRWPGAIQPGGVILCIILFNTPVATYVSYSLNRIFDTAFGVILSIVINHLFPRERVVRFLNKLGVHKLDDMEEL
jgi:uncharacterized membrane protein YgaE (UPF0421/DUF939 family)